MKQVPTCSYLPTKLQAMLLLFNKSESLECAKVVVLKLGAIPFNNNLILIMRAFHEMIKRA